MWHEKIVGCAGRHLPYENFFSNTTAKQNRNFFQHLVFVAADLIVLWRAAKSNPKRITTRHNRNFVNWICFGQQLRHNSMA